jgi:hypothetical protein
MGILLVPPHRRIPQPPAQPKHLASRPQRRPPANLVRIERILLFLGGESVPSVFVPDHRGTPVPAPSRTVVDQTTGDGVDDVVNADAEKAKTGVGDKEGDSEIDMDSEASSVERWRTEAGWGNLPFGTESKGTGHGRCEQA